MDYKLLRALSIILQAGLVILLLMLISLFFLSCKPAVSKPSAKIKVNTEMRREIMEQRFLNEVQKRQLNRKVLCLKSQTLQVDQPIKLITARTYFAYNGKRA